MKTLIQITYNEYENFINTIDTLRREQHKIVQESQIEINKLNEEIKFLKDSGENILVIVKHQDKPDVHEYKSTEKNIITDLVQENYRIRDRYDELSRQIDNVENQKQMIILKYKEMETIYKNQLDKLESHINSLENRGIWSRIKNDKKKYSQPIFY